MEERERLTFTGWFRSAPCAKFGTMTGTITVERIAGVALIANDAIVPGSLVNQFVQAIEQIQWQPTVNN